MHVLHSRWLSKEISRSLQRTAIWAHLHAGLWTAWWTCSACLLNGQPDWECINIRARGGEDGLTQGERKRSCEINTVAQEWLNVCECVMERKLTVRSPKQRNRDAEPCFLVSPDPYCTACRITGIHCCTTQWWEAIISWMDINVHAWVGQKQPGGSQRSLLF